MRMKKGFTLVEVSILFVIFLIVDNSKNESEASVEYDGG